MVVNFVFALLFLVGFGLLVMKIAKDKEWKLPAGLAALGAGALGWWTNFADKVASWF